MAAPEDEQPQYETRTVELPDGTRLGVVHKPGALDGYSDEDLIAMGDRHFPES